MKAAFCDFGGQRITNQNHVGVKSAEAAREVAEGLPPGGCCAPAEGEPCRCLLLQERLALLPILLHSCTGAALPCKARENNERSGADLVQAPPEKNTKALDGNIPPDSSPGGSLLFFYFHPPGIPGLLHPEARGSPDSDS